MYGVTLGSMRPRQNIDIGITQLLKGLARCALPIARQEIRASVEDKFSDHSFHAVSALSVRTGLDLFLQAANFPVGSEVLVSALTIPDVKRIIEHHNLKVVSIDVDPATLAPKLDNANRLAGPKTVAILIAHLFGTRVPVEPWIAFAHIAHRERYGQPLQLWEDCAQAFIGLDDPHLNHDQTDVAMFSFGPIKTSTALGGAVLRFRDRSIADSVKRKRDELPIHSRIRFSKRLVKYLALKFLSHPRFFPWFVRRVERKGMTLNEVISQAMRGFSGDELFSKLRHQMCTPQIALLHTRLQENHSGRIQQRSSNGRRLADQLADHIERPGQAMHSSYWVFPILCDSPEQVQVQLLDAGFDSTIRPTLRAIASTDENNTNWIGDRPMAPSDAIICQQRSIYVPVYAGLSEEEIDHLAKLLNQMLEDSN